MRSRLRLLAIGPTVTAVAALSVASSFMAVQPSTALASSASYTSTETIPVPPASAYAGSGGGDGWAVAVGNGVIYNVFHHSPVLTVACHLQADASPCWAPETITDASGDDFATSGQPGLSLDQNTGKLYVFATRSSDGTGGVVCIDTTEAATNSDPFCGFSALTAVGDAPIDGGISGVSAPATVTKRWYAFNFVAGADQTGTENELMCFDLTTHAPCAGQPFPVSIGAGAVEDGDFPPPAVAAIGSEVVIPITVNGVDELACLDGNTQQACFGSWPVALNGSYGDSDDGAPYPMLTSTGAVNGLCLPTGVDPCYSSSGSPAVTPPGMTAAIAATSGWNGAALVVGARVYVPNGNSDQVDCYDYSALSGCANFPLSLSGLDLLYTANPDPLRPTCIWVNSDNGGSQIQNFDAYTGQGCDTGAVRVLASSLLPSTIVCAPSTYTSLQVTSPAPGTYTSGTVEFEDSDGNPIAGMPDEAIGPNGSVSLAGLHLSASQGLPQFVITLNGTQGAPSTVVVQLRWTRTGSYDPVCVSGDGPYVGLGDSFSSGEGNDGTYLAGTDTSPDFCHRSGLSYEFDVNNDVGFEGARFSFHACSGALVSDFTSRNHEGNDEPPQLNWLTTGTGPQASLVTLTIGGNDAHFADVMNDCVFYALGLRTAPCEQEWNTRVNQAISSMGSTSPSQPLSLVRLYNTIATDAPNATIVVLGYPRFFPTTPPQSCGTGAVGSQFEPSTMQWINDEIKSMDNTISGAVTATHNPHILYADAYNAFNGHERCTKDPYLNGARPTTNAEILKGSFHPNATGQYVLSTIVESRLGE